MKSIYTNMLVSLLMTQTFIASPAMASDTPIRPIKEVFEPAEPADVSKFVKVAVVQWNPYSPVPVAISAAEAEKIKANHREEMKTRIEKAASKGAEIIILSEFAVVGYPDIPELESEDDNFRNREDISPYVETVPGKSSHFFAALSKKLNVYIQFGMAEKDAETDAYYNTAVAVDPKGKIVAKYRKRHLYQIEHDYLSEGTEAVTYKTPAGQVGIIICSDSYSGEVLSDYAALKVDVMALSTSWAQMNTGMGIFKSAARQIGSYLLAANQTYYPDSGVINPNGTTQSHIRQSGDAIAYGYLPRK